MTCVETPEGVTFRTLGKPQNWTTVGGNDSNRLEFDS
jgi:hypothetical protein